MDRKPVLLTIQLVLDENNRFCAEVQIVYDDGSLCKKRFPAHEKLSLQFNELEPVLPSHP
jgi:hypothetical protein